jgi:hypothetical protein
MSAGGASRGGNSSSALSRVRAAVHPRALAERVAEAFERSPIAFLFAFALGTGIAYFSGRGVGGALPWLPGILAGVIGVGSVLAQVGLLGMLKSRSGPRARLWIALWLISGWNALSFAAGVVSSDGDRMGRYYVSGELRPIVAEATTRAGVLDTYAARLGALAAYSAERAAIEGAPKGQGYAPTCQTSAGAGPGPITDWRNNTGKTATGLADGLRGQANIARDAANTADRTTATYAAAQHDAAMTAISKAVSDIAAATAGADIPAVTRFLVTLDAETKSGGTCPDPQMQTLIEGIRSVDTSRLSAPIIFEAPNRPSEAEAVNKLFAALFSLDWAQLELYRQWLLVSPLADFFFMMFAGMLLPRQRHPDDDDILAERLGLDADDAPLVPQALDAAAADTEWQALLADLVPAGGRFIRVSRLHVAPDDWARLRRLQILARQGKIYDAGVIGEFHVFNLRPSYLRNRFDQIVRRTVERDRVAAARDQANSEGELA